MPAQTGFSWSAPVAANYIDELNFAQLSKLRMNPSLVCDDTTFVGSFNLSRSGEKNAENVLEIEDAAIAERLSAYVDEVRGRYPAASLPG